MNTETPQPMTLVHMDKDRPRIYTYNRHGMFEVTGYSLDLAIARFLPASVNDLAAEYKAQTDVDVSDIHTVTELLIMLTDLFFADYNSTDPVPHSIRLPAE